MGSASAAVICSVLPKLAALLSEEYELPKGLRGEIRFLTLELECMFAFLGRVDGLEEWSALAKAWKRDVTELAYDIEDCIDEFMHRGESVPLGIKAFFRTLDKTRARQNIMHQIQVFKARIVEARKRSVRYNIDVSRSSHSNAVHVDPPVPSQPARAEAAAFLVDVDGPRDDIAGWLAAGESRSSQQLKVKVVSIVGFGGLGKTVLAFQVFDKMKGQFECSAFVSVAQDADTSKILSEILAKVGPWRRERGDQQELVGKLRESLKNRRYLIVIDDLGRKSSWEVIKFALCENNRGSRIMITTSINSVAYSCCSNRDDRVYKMKSLNEQASRKLFFTKAFGSEDSWPPDFAEPYNEILRKCGGMPLAITGMANLWREREREAKRYVGSKFREAPEIAKVQQVLSLSYGDLPSWSLKTCLLYLSIFPEDYIIEKDCLIKKWIAEGFVYYATEQTVEEIAESYLNELIDSNFIQPVEYCNNLEVVTCQVNYMMLQSIISWSNEGDLHINSGVLNSVEPAKLQWLSLHSNPELLTHLEGLNLSCTRSLTIFVGISRPNKFSFRKFIYLQVLDLEGWESLVNKDLLDICTLVLLKYLSIKKTQISKLPEQIAQLQYLETLDLRKTQISKLPPQICQLQSLAHLLVGDINSHERIKIPDEIKHLKSLQTLSTVDLTECVSSVQDLTELRELAIVWYFDGFPDTGLGELPSLAELRKLRSLTIYCDFNCSMGSCSLSYPPPDLRKLKVSRRFINVPQWIENLDKLTSLEVKVCKFGEDDLNVLQKLPYLCFLVLGLEFLPERLMLLKNVGFLSLEKFSVDCWVPGLTFEQGSMPKLKDFELKFRAGPGNLIPSGIIHLQSLKQVVLWYSSWCAKSSSVQLTVNTVRSEVAAHRNYVRFLNNDNEEYVEKSNTEEMPSGATEEMNVPPTDVAGPSEIKEI